MQSNRPQDERSPFDLFADFGSSIHGRNPFDDPFFTTRPFDSAFYRSNPVSGSRSVVPPSEPVIQELSSDDDEDLKNAQRSNEPFVNHPDDESDDGQEDIKYTTGDNTTVISTQPRSFKVTSCKVSYGGVDGVYYSSSSTRRMGSDGVIMEESKEADKSKGEAIHRVSRGLHDKGHSVTRKLNSDGKVDTSETLHNLNEDELGNFEEAWRSNSGSRLPSWTGPQGMDRTSDAFLLPSTTHVQSVPNSERSQGNPSGSRSKKVIRIPIE